MTRPDLELIEHTAVTAPPGQTPHYTVQLMRHKAPRAPHDVQWQAVPCTFAVKEKFYAEPEEEGICSIRPSRAALKGLGRTARSTTAVVFSGN